MTEDEAQASVERMERCVGHWEKMPDGFFVCAVDPVTGELGLSKTFGGPMIERGMPAQYVSAFTDEPRERFRHSDMVRKVAT